MLKLLIALLYPGLVAAAGYFQPAALLLAGLYLALSILAFLVYAIDKQAAVRGTWRIPEAQLHLVALLGGWPGALAAQQTLRHKTKKTSFRRVFRITVWLNIGTTIVLFTPTGLPLMNALSGLLRP